MMTQPLELGSPVDDPLERESRWAGGEANPEITKATLSPSSATTQKLRAWKKPA
jgi:hypothetical protein